MCNLVTLAHVLIADLSYSLLSNIYGSWACGTDFIVRIVYSIESYFSIFSKMKTRNKKVQATLEEIAGVLIITNQHVNKQLLQGHWLSENFRSR